MTINEIVHKALMVGIGVPEKVKELVDELVKKGELSKSQGAKIVKECSEKVTKSGEEVSKSISDLINKSLEKMNIPTKDEVEKLQKKITALSTRVKKLEESSQVREV
jgi:polyhydroxyalkanoate synthesis regulator phasin